MFDEDLIARAARILREGGLVAFPTETVYGLGADACNVHAVQKVFGAKGRPATHPLIVHVSDVARLEQVAKRWTPQGKLLAERFWPGPLTLVVNKNPTIPDVVTGGRPTVAVRVPSHPMALDLLRAFGGPIAAPSANRFGRVSPTSAEHVRGDLGEAVDLVLDGGSADVGLESTIVDVSAETPRVLRLGGVTLEQLEETLQQDLAVELTGTSAPGQLPSHYAPQAAVVIVDAPELVNRTRHLQDQGLRVATLATDEIEGELPAHARLPRDAAGYARNLYSALRSLDEAGPDVILVVLPEERGVGRAVADRVRRAAAPRPVSGEKATPHRK